MDKGNGQVERFNTGAVRDQQDGKSRPDLISPIFIRRLGDWLRDGAEKYAERNWEMGMPMSRCVASLCRHLNQFREGKTDEDHLAAIAFNVMALIHYQEMADAGALPVEYCDLPNYQFNDTYADEGKREIKSIETGLNDWCEKMNNILT